MNIRGELGSLTPKQRQKVANLVLDLLVSPRCEELFKALLHKAILDTAEKVVKQKNIRFSRSRR